METKTAKIAAVQENQRSYVSKHGQTFIHLIKVDGSDQVWEYHSLKPVCEKFKIGETVNADFDIQQNGQYTNYRIKPRQDNTSGFSGKKADPKDSGVITYLSCFSSACNYYAQRQATTAEVLEFTEKAFTAAMAHTTLPK